jgi:hypothetical protein
MGYSEEYKKWTNADVEATFAISDDSLQPTETNDLSCEGIGFNGMLKTANGVLMLKMIADNEDGYILEPFTDVWVRYTSEPYIPNPPQPEEE